MSDAVLQRLLELTDRARLRSQRRNTLSKKTNISHRWSSSSTTSRNQQGGDATMARINNRMRKKSIVEESPSTQNR
jgi:hypothetical protein